MWQQEAMPGLLEIMRERSRAFLRSWPQVLTSQSHPMKQPSSYRLQTCHVAREGDFLIVEAISLGTPQIAPKMSQQSLGSDENQANTTANNNRQTLKSDPVHSWQEHLWELAGKYELVQFFLKASWQQPHKHTCHQPVWLS